MILRYRLHDLPEPSSKAPVLFEAIHAGRTSDPVTLAEVACVLASFYKDPPAEIVSGLERIVKHDAFRILEEALYHKAPRLYPGGGANWTGNGVYFGWQPSANPDRIARPSLGPESGRQSYRSGYDTAATRKEYHLLYVNSGFTPGPSRHLTPSAWPGYALRQAATGGTQAMRFHRGAIPSPPDFVPDASWRMLRQAPSPKLENLFALPIGVVAALVVAALWFRFTPLADLTPAMALPAYLFAVAGLIVVHEMIHALVHPMAGLSPHSVLVFWPSVGLFAHYDGEMSRNRLVAILLMPLLILSIVPLLVAAAAQVSSGWVAFVSTLNALGTCADMLLAGLVLFQVPATATVRFQSWRVFWRVGNG